MKKLFSVCVLASLASLASLHAQSKPPLTPADYGQFETLAPMPNHGGLSPDGRWLAYGINRANRNNELRITSLADGTTKVAAFGTQAVFADDSRWVAYAIGVSESQEEKLRKDKKPVHRKLGLQDLAGGQPTIVDDVESFAFEPGGGHLAMRKYAPEKPPARDGADSAAETEGAPGATLIVRDLATGRDTTFGSVSEYAWQDKGPLLALTIATDDKTGNSVAIFDAKSGALRTLDSSAAVYSGLAWRRHADGLAVLRSRADDRHDGATQLLLAWTGVASGRDTRRIYDPTTDAAFPKGMRLASFRTPSWSDDGRVVFVGVAKWSGTEVAARPGTEVGAAHGTEVAAAPGTEVVGDEEPAGVDVWHWRDVDVIPKQKLQAKANRERTLLAAWHPDTNRLVQVAAEFSESVTPVKHANVAYIENWTSYAMDRSIGRPAADLYLADLTTGERTRLKERVDDRRAQVSPGGRYVLFVQDDHYWTIDLTTHAIVNITKGVATSFIDRESDQTVKQKPPFGVAGWLAQDEAVLLYDKFDIWRIGPDGSRPTRLTDGAPEQIRHRYVRLDPEEEAIDPAKPMYVSLFGIWSKKSGYGRVRAGAPVERLVWLEKSVHQLAKAKDADVYSYIAEGYNDSPDVFAGGADLKDAKQATHTNPFLDKYAWGRAEIVEYRNAGGERLQGALYYPANYEPGRKYPMVVYLYERLSDSLHRFVAPSDRAESNATVFNSRGYFVLEPDIVFRPREPGLSVADCVGSAVKKVVQTGLVDPKRVGVIGHSWGGFDTSFLVTHTDLFAAGVAGAPITDLVSNYGNHHWSSGIAETDHIETGQQRMEVPLYDDLQAYIRNSAVFAVAQMKTPLLIEVGDADGTVFWHQGVELYNIARRAKKDVVLLQYAGEDHGLRKKANQLDYHRRIIEWFGHYLQDEPAPAWIADGVSYLDREQELEALKKKP